MGTHLFAFKYIGKQWYGFDANFEDKAGPFDTFDAAVTFTFNRHNTIRFNFKDQPGFQINIDGILKPKLGDQSIPHDNGFAALTQLDSIEQYPYAAMSRSDLSFGVHDVSVETEIFFVIAAWVFMIACLCCVCGVLFGGWLGHTTKRQKTNDWKVARVAPV